MKRRMLAVVLSLVMTAGLIGCSQSDGGEGGSEEGKKEKTGYPEKAITVIVPWSAGGGNDIAARELQPVFKEKFGANLLLKM